MLGVFFDGLIVWPLKVCVSMFMNVFKPRKTGCSKILFVVAKTTLYFSCETGLLCEPKMTRFGSKKCTVSL